VGRGRPTGYGNYQWLSPGSRTLRLRDAGDDVKFLQRHIGAEPDGYFGPDTARALAEFRERHGLGGAEGAAAGGTGTSGTGLGTGDPSTSDLAEVVAGRDVWAAVLGTTNPTHRTRRRWRLGGDPRMVRR
jgi:peptidoglycan hydrolase-like protein with peptidoglycan-binding domain